MYPGFNYNLHLALYNYYYYNMARFMHGGYPPAEDCWSWDSFLEHLDEDHHCEHGGICNLLRTRKFEMVFHHFAECDDRDCARWGFWPALCEEWNLVAQRILQVDGIAKNDYWGYVNFVQELYCRIERLPNPNPSRRRMVLWYDRQRQ